jgi:hypothetical protein
MTSTAAVSVASQAMARNNKRRRIDNIEEVVAGDDIPLD